MIRIAHIITTLEQGGAENMLFKLVSNTAHHQSYRQMVISLAGKGHFGSLMEKRGVHVYPAGIQWRFFDIVRLCKLIAEVRRFQPHVIQTWLYHSDFLGTLISPFIRTSRLVWNIRCSNMAFEDYAWTTDMIFRILKGLSGIPSVVCANSLSGIKTHKQKGYHPKKWVWIPNGFDIDQFKPRPKRSQFKKRLGIPGASQVIGMVARFDPMKDFDNFFRAAGILIKGRNNVHFVLAGNKVNFENSILRGLVDQHHLTGKVHLLGRRNDLYEIYPEMDVFTLSSSFGEGFPNVIGEAMACGVPCVATDVGDSRQVIGETGCVVPIKDPNELAKAWKNILNAPEKTKVRLGQAARRRIVDKYRIDLIQDRYLSLYDSLVPQR